MDIVEIYFGFHRPATLREICKEDVSWTTMLGHVEAFGYTIDDTWFFYDPGREVANLHITHMHDEVERLIAERFNRAACVLRMPYEPKSLRVPLHMPMTCATQCAHLVGLRAFTPNGLQWKLLQQNAEVLKWDHPTKKTPKTETRVFENGANPCLNDEWRQKNKPEI